MLELPFQERKREDQVPSAQKNKEYIYEGAGRQPAAPNPKEAQEILILCTLRMCTDHRISIRRYE